MQITDRIEQQRAAAGLSEAQLAAQSGIPRTTLQRRMVKPDDWKISELESVAAVLGVSCGWLVGYEDVA